MTASRVWNLFASPEAPSLQEIDYAIRVSTRARHPRLTIDGDGSLTIVVPKRFPRQQIPRLVADHEEWILKTRTHLEAFPQRVTALECPSAIYLAAIDEHWRVRFTGDNTFDHRTHHRQASLWDPPLQAIDSTILLPTEETATAVRQLHAWALDRARLKLPAVVAELADSTGLQPNRVVVRSQRTRWASCSPSRAISLNWRALLLPPQLLNHLVIHELAHLRHMNHSRDFWNLVAKFDDSSSMHRRELRAFEANLPGWAGFDVR